MIFMIYSEWSIINDIVVREHHQLTISFIREIFTVRELVTSLLHRDTLPIRVTGELISLNVTIKFKIEVF